MAAFTVVIQDGSASASQLARWLDKSDKRRAFKALLNYLHGILSGSMSGFLTTQVGSAFASQTVTVSQAAAVNGTDTLVIAGSNGATLAVVASPANENQFLKGASNAAFATNLAAAINAHATLSKFVRAKASGAVVTIYSLVPGILGNLITLSETGNGFTLGAAALAGGTSDEADHHAFGYDPRV